VTGGSWRHPQNDALNFLSIDHWTTLARTLENAGFDFLFFADSYGYPILADAVIDTAVREAVNFPQADPIVLASAVAAVTDRLGIVVTSSTTAERPQAVARRYATLDNLTAGRVGWNIVTGSGQAASARLFGESMVAHDRRYEIADDHVQVALKLWEGSWEEGALVADKESGIYADPKKVHEIVHEGEHHRAHGLLTVPPSPQRTPVLFQAGTSGKGRNFAARYAEAVFLAGGDPAHVAGHIADIKRLATESGRDAESLTFLVGAGFILAPSEEEARAKQEILLSFSTTEAAATAYAYLTGIDLLARDPDAPLGGVRTEQGQSSVERFTKAAAGPTVAEILEDYRVNGVNGTTFTGAPHSVADRMEEFLAVTGADGFLVQPFTTPQTFDDFAELLVPVLRERGLLADAPAGTTLRERLYAPGMRHLPADHPGSALRAVD
jgi:FMN-dependent oxidoreductase (nitrilotriacetate monooxygenase family)